MLGNSGKSKGFKFTAERLLFRGEGRERVAALSLFFNRHSVVWNLKKKFPLKAALSANKYNRQ